MQGFFKKTGNKAKLLIGATGIMLLLTISPAKANSLIRDAEIETLLYDLSSPVFRAAGLEPENIHMYIVSDDAINAYVAGGMNIFVNTGLIVRCPNPEMLVGVIAHETGHIAGGHLLKGMEEYKAANIKSMLGYALGLAAAVAGSPEAGQAIALGTTHISERQFLKYTRSHEESADQAAVTYLDRVHLTSQGLLDLLTILYKEEHTLYGELNPYALTHPLSGERISHVRNHIAHSAYAQKHFSSNQYERYERVVAKLKAFLQPPERTLKDYPHQDKSDSAYYARAIAYYKVPTLPKAIEAADYLIKKYPKNPYYHELKGQILLENGHVAEAIPFYKNAVTLAPDNALLKIQLGSALITLEDNSNIEQAVQNLNQGLATEKNNAFAWHQLGIAEGRRNNLGLSYLALTQEAVILDRKEDVEAFAELAKKYLDVGSPAYMTLQDILDTYEKKR